MDDNDYKEEIDNDEFNQISSNRKEMIVYDDKNEETENENDIEEDLSNFNQSNFIRAISDFHDFLEEGVPDESVRCFEYIVNYFKNVPISETMYEQINETNLVEDLIDYIDMFDDEIDIIMDSLRCLHTLIMNSADMRISFIESAGFDILFRLLQPCNEPHDIESKPNELVNLVFDMIKLMFSEPLSAAVLDTDLFFVIVQKYLHLSRDPLILMNIASIIALSVHYLTNQKRRFFEMGIEFFELLKTLNSDEYDCENMMEIITNSFEMIVLGSFSATHEYTLSHDDVIWLIDNNIIPFCLQDAEGFPLSVQMHLLRVLSLIFNRVVYHSGNEKHLEEEIKMKKVLIEASNNIPTERIIEFLNISYQNEDRDFLCSVLELVESIVQHNEDFFHKIAEYPIFFTVIGLFADSDYKIRKAIVNLLYECSPFFNSDFVSKIISEDFVDVLEALVTNKFDISEKVYQLCLTLFAFTDENDEVHHLLNEILEGNDPSENK